MGGEIDSSSNGAEAGNEPRSSLLKRKLIFRDSATLLVFVLATVVLYVVTSFLFRSFSTRRAELAKQYSARGSAALRRRDPEQAIVALRVAQSYAPDARRNHLLLAEALAQANHTEEATNYFLNLRESEPADGFINLELARLARKKGNTPQAIDYYRASSLGNWEGDAIAKRRQVQLELADYLAQNGQLAAARAEILVSAANAPETAQLDILFGDRLLQTKDRVDALTYYQKAVDLDRHNFTALFKAGSTAYALGKYKAAEALLKMASREALKSPKRKENEAKLATLLPNAERISQLTLAKNQPAQERARHLRSVWPIAKARLDECTSRFTNANAGAPNPAPLPDPLQSLNLKWLSVQSLLRHRADLENAANEDSLTQLIYDTELQTAQVCGPPTGDDALLLLLAKGPQ